MILYIETPKDSIRKLLELINEFSKVAGYKTNTQKSLALLYTNNEKSEREIKESIPFTIATKRIKYLVINLPKETKELYRENYKTLKILKDMGIPDHVTSRLRNLYAGQEATARTGQGTTDWFQIGKGVCQGCILSPCLFNLHTECIIRNPGLDEAQDGIKIGRRNISDLRHADDSTRLAESKGETKEPLDKGERGE